jgi:hypothetical protein
MSRPLLLRTIYRAAGLHASTAVFYHAADFDAAVMFFHVIAAAAQKSMRSVIWIWRGLPIVLFTAPRPEGQL